MLLDVFLYNNYMGRTWSRMACWTSGLVTEGAATDSPNVPSGKDHWNWRSCLICKTWRLINKTRAWLLESIRCNYLMWSRCSNIQVCGSVLHLCFCPQLLLDSFRHFQYQRVATKYFQLLSWLYNGTEDNQTMQYENLVRRYYLRFCRWEENQRTEGQNGEFE